MHCFERVLLTASLCLGNAHAGEAYDQLYMKYDFPKQLKRTEVPVCSHHGCEIVTRVDLTGQHWERLSRHFKPQASDAAGEREQIRSAVAEAERITGILAGTSYDRAGDLAAFGTFKPQLDCIDESANTTTYLTLFEQAGLLRWHSVQRRAHRGYLFFGGWPHFTAVVEENGSGRRWVVDSWFRDNGVAPDVVDLDTWKDGWKPAGFTF
jgi:hypothetical protein